MKKLFLFVLLLALLTGCASTAASSVSSQASSVVPVVSSASPQTSAAEDEDILYVHEPYMDAQCRDILTYPDDYAGVTIRIQGMYYSWDDTLCGLRHSVVRYCQDGCCGGGLTGLEIFYEGERPEENAWVEATGTIEVLPLGEYPLPFPLLVVTELRVMEDRGNETVYN